MNYGILKTRNFLYHTEREPMEKLIKLEEAAKQLNIEKITLLRAIAAGKLKAVKLGRGYQTKQTWLDEYVASLEVNATEVK